MAGMIPMRELRALAKRAGMALGKEYPEEADDFTWETCLYLDPLGDQMSRGLCIWPSGSGWLALYGVGQTKRAARIQARANAKLFLECVLAMEYGEKEGE